MVDAREYHERTNHSPRSVRESSHRLDPATKPRPYKLYADRPTVEPATDPARIETPALAAVSQSRADGRPEGISPAADPPPVHTLCHYATGVTKTIQRGGQSIPYRAAACTGKLYHVDLYLVTGDCGPDGAGVYHFDPRHDRFDVLRSGDYRGVLATATGGGTAVDDAPVTLVATSTWWRNAWKYRDRTYRHAFWDAGTVLANLLAVAHGAGHRAQAVAGFADDRVVDLLGVDPAREAPVALVAVGEGDSAPDPRAVDRIDPDLDPNTTPTVDRSLISDAWRQSTLPDGDAAADWRERACSDEGIGDSDAVAEGEQIPLDPVGPDAATARPITETIERRGSLRDYAHDPVSDRMAATVLDRALAGLPIAWSRGAAGRAPGTLVNCDCLVHGVSGVPGGVYRYDPASAALDLVGPTSRETAGHLALDQDVVGDAAMNAYLVADVDGVVDTLGNRGYRAAMLEAGLSLGRLYLATYAHLALGGRGFTFYDRLVADHLAPTGDDTSCLPMTLFAFGRPDSDRRD